VLSKSELDVFLKIVEGRIVEANKTGSVHPEGDMGDLSSPSKSIAVESQSGSDDEEDVVNLDAAMDTAEQKQKLQVIPVQNLKSILKDDMNNKNDVVSAIENLSNESLYGSFAYHVPLLQELCRDNVVASTRRERSAARSRSTIMRNASFSQFSNRGANRFSPNSNGTNGSNTSAQSALSLRFGRTTPNNSVSGGKSPKQEPNSVHGSNVYSTIGKVVSASRLAGSRKAQSVYVKSSSAAA